MFIVIFLNRETSVIETSVIEENSRKYSCESHHFMYNNVASLLANRGRLLLRTPGPVPLGTCICSDVETILSWACYVYGTFEFRASLGTSILLQDGQ